MGLRYCSIILSFAVSVVVTASLARAQDSSIVLSDSTIGVPVVLDGVTIIPLHCMTIRDGRAATVAQQHLPASFRALAFRILPTTLQPTFTGAPESRTGQEGGNP